MTSIPLFPLNLWECSCLFSPLRRRVQIESLGNILSEVPWMRFRVIAEPDMAIFMKDQRIQSIIQSITNQKVTSVKKQIMVEFQESVTRTVETLMKEMTKIVDTHMTSVETSVVSRFSSMSSLKTVSTATVCQPLGKDSHLCTCHHHHHHHHHENNEDCESPVPAYPGSPLQKPPVFVDPPTFNKALWIWSKEAKDDNKIVPGGSRPFRKTLQLESHADMVTIDITCDNFYTLYVNGKLVGSGKEWYKPDRWTVRFEPTKKVVIAVYGVQDPATLGYVGLLVSGKAWNGQEAIPHAKEFVSDKTWMTLSSQPIVEDFVKSEFVDSLWEPAHEVKKFGEHPWEGLSKVKPEAGRLPRKNLVGIEGVKESPIPRAGVADIIVPHPKK